MSSQMRRTVRGASSADLTTTVLAGDEGWGDFQRHQEHGDVPGDDGADDAEGLADGDAEDVGGEGDGFAFEFAAEATVHVEDVGDGLGFDAAFGSEGLAGFEGDEAGELFGVVAEEGGALGDEGAALAGGELGPGLLGLVGVADGGVDVGCVAVRGFGDLLVGGRVDDGEGFSAAGGDEAAGDEVFAAEGGGEGGLVEGGGLGGGVWSIQHGFALRGEFL